jgi:sulfur carrier protein
MEISVNGQKKNFPESLTVSDLLAALGIDPKSVAVEKNLTIVTRAETQTETIRNGDVIEIIRLVGGG